MHVLGELNSTTSLDLVCSVGGTPKDKARAQRARNLLFCKARMMPLTL